MDVVNQQLQSLSWSDAAYLAPEWILIACAVLLVILDLVLPRNVNRAVIGWFTLAGLLTSLGFVVWRLIDMNSSAPVMGEDGKAASNVISLLADSYRIDDFASLFKIVFLIATALIVLMSLGSVKSSDIPDKGEFYYLLLPAVVGAMIMASSGDMLTLYIGLELLSITTYVLVGIRKHAVVSAEAAFKYVVTGGISSALVLFGMSYLYGITGATNLGAIAHGIQQHASDYKEMLYVAFFFLLAGLGIKIAAAPFHVWAPDVYQGAPSPITAFLAVVSKGAAFAIVFRIIYNVIFYASSADAPITDDIFLTLLIMAAAAMLIGSAAALRQHNVKRLLALSGVANAGYLLVPVGLALGDMHVSNFGEFIFYLAVYLLMTIGALAVVTVISKAAGHDELEGFAGLYYRAPWTAIAMTVFVLSLAGLPITGGFFGKLFILLGAAQTKTYWIIAVMVISSVISYFFYFGFIRQMFMRSTSEEQVHIPFTTGIVIWLCVAATVALGIVPGPVLSWVNDNFSIVSDLFVGKR
ncbi:NADH-quinone oxidoreductase subunit N [Paenibacillus baekrokdamisoli]|uniref:NADH-quinone oxidoreductase subunit N n=1 Tax=Paenibacillus baekrokdamisoli TaxID=1712516 RepID=A0A3G9IYB7_9BACL|nr:NADH-quinone oxidoreductase subunit N [Paenibacillus baekrokdamisoli]MBB3069052.1 NADH-quinone oxidoreductase subunit N [Paenibacillus baekrokdamisoli]BBH23870.1 NADH-quinone oxidoreductase subunit N [Paenibacillus baekrokdamisoli]